MEIWPHRSRQWRWATKKLAAIREALGQRCAACGALDDLEIDCVVPQGHRHHQAGVTGRACFYARQLTAGNLQLLCPRCHARKTRAEASTEPTMLDLINQEDPY